MFLIYFIAGIVFATVIAPLLDALTVLIVTGIEVIKGKWTLKITEYNYQIQKIGEDDECNHKHPIGFAVPVEEDDYEEN